MTCKGNQEWSDFEEVEVRKEKAFQEPYALLSLSDADSVLDVRLDYSLAVEVVVGLLDIEEVAQELARAGYIFEIVDTISELLEREAATRATTE